jgi:AcrR family transcriptional regulator
MRYSKEHKAATRQHLLEVSGALAKEKGFTASGVDALMSAVGLTSGAFYSHFSSKAELLSALVAHELESSAERLNAAPPELPPEQWIAKQLQRYLSWEHVQQPAKGCALPTLGAEVARADQATKRQFEQALGKLHGAWAEKLGDEQQAWAVLSQLVGAVLLARAMASEGLGKEILQASRQFLGDALAKVTKG